MRVNSHLTAKASLAGKLAGQGGKVCGPAGSEIRLAPDGTVQDVKLNRSRGRKKCTAAGNTSQLSACDGIETTMGILISLPVGQLRSGKQ
jgi:hypothetical protein